MTRNPLFDTSQTTLASPEARAAGVDWCALEATLNINGYAVLPRLLGPGLCSAVANYFADDDLFRSHVDMERYVLGRGEYKEFDYPLPEAVDQLRTSFYPYLAPIANRWHHEMRIRERFPANFAEFHDICHQSGQMLSTPLLQRYQANGYCRLHQDLYGQHVFPFQIIVLLDEPGRDFEGGEFLLVETDPTKPGRAEVIPLHQGDAMVLAVNYAPRRSKHGPYRARYRHGLSQLRRGFCHILNIVFHDAR